MPPPGTVNEVPRAVDKSIDTPGESTMKTVCLLALAGTAATAMAQPLVIPAAYAAASGGVTPTDTVFREFARTHQQVISASLLSAIPAGSTITQLTLRASNFGTMNALGNWPAAPLTFASFEVYLAKAARAPGSMSTVLSENIVPGSEVRVRTGILTVPAGAFSNFVAAPGANPWGLDLPLAPFTYTGGDLVITIRHSGHQTPLTPRLFLDSAPNGASGMQCMSASGAGATVGMTDQGLPSIVRVRYVRPPSCIANCDGSTVAPTLTANDFICFVNAFSKDSALSQAEQIASTANCDLSTTPPVLNIGDFICFNGRYAAGCP